MKRNKDNAKITFSPTPFLSTLNMAPFLTLLCSPFHIMQCRGDKEEGCGQFVTLHLSTLSSYFSPCCNMGATKGC